MERVQAKPTFERQSDDVIFSLGEHGSAPISVGGEDAVLEFHYEVTIEHWVRDDRSRPSRCPLVLLGLGGRRRASLAAGEGHRRRGDDGAGSRIGPARAQPALPAARQGRPA